MDRKFRSFVISPDGDVTVQFNEEVIVAQSRKPSKEDDDEDDDQTSVDKFTATTSRVPHKDLFDCLTALKKLSLDVCEITITGKELSTWGVTGIKIAGDMVLKKSRAQLRLTKYVKRSKKSLHFWSPQVTMYPDKEDAVKFENADKLTDLIESAIQEIEEYLGGKSAVEGQLPLFADRGVAV